MASLDSDTNKVYRKKYFMDAEKVVFSDIEEQKEIKDEVCPLITAEDVQVEDDAVTITHGLDHPQEAIRVEALKEGDRVTKLKIVCPCGRQTEIDLQYAPEHTARK
ncbi:MAG: hypothetical protein PHP44_00410 [Kiritimatiellae bacterium]|nr:hypothetical protein [Kiritimatiellia bacterium]MDD4734545.1 hypothetical protein [Kiritimatiellia bacterium]